MQFSDSTFDQGIVQDARWLVGANETTYPINHLTRRINRRWLEIKAKISLYSGRWQQGEAEYSDDLASGTQGYTVPRTHVRINRVEIKLESGAHKRLTPIDKADVTTSIKDFLNVDGVPEYYDMSGSTMNLYPTPNYSQADSLIWWYEGVPDYFETTDTTETPDGIELVDDYLAVGAALDYSKRSVVRNKEDLKEDLALLDDLIGQIINHRNGDDPIQIRVRQPNYR